MQREVDRQKYIDAYYENEYDANRRMSFALLFAAALLTIIFIGYITDLFTVSKQSKVITTIVFPFAIFCLISPMFYIKTKKIRNPRYKYFLLFNFIFVVSILNVIVPKHAILGWAICIMLANHYYNPKVGRIIFIISSISMLFCIYAGMFLGEFDPNLLTGHSDEKQGLIFNAFLEGQSFPDTPEGRYDYLHVLLDRGENRYLKAFIFYFLARFVCLSILYYASYTLTKRTYRLLIDEIKVNSEQEKTSVELEVAKEIQLQALAKEFVMTEDIEIQAELKAARTVGGDFYDYLPLDKEHVGFIIGDVSGKGIGAAMYMMRTLTIFKDIANIAISPAETLKALNRKIYDENSNMFVTCFYGILNIKNGELIYANAGHTRPVIGRKSKYHYLKCSTGFVLGGLEEAYVIDEKYVMQNGETITLYTDGITEARNNEGAFYGDKRLIDLFNKKNYSCLLELHAELKDDVYAFCEGAEQSDDITYLTIKYHGAKYDYQEKTFTSELDNVKDMLSFLSDYANQKSINKAFINNLLVVGDELLSNISKYGYKDTVGEIYIRLLYNVSEQELILTIIDKGVPFNPFINEGSPIGGDVDNIKEGGLGILIVKNLMSEYAYDRINGKNIITLKKKF